MSWLPATDGYTLLFNRDERRTRAPGIPPTLAERSGLAYLAPIDGDAGGSWIAVNEMGVTVALLNRYDDTPIDDVAGRVSRGLLLVTTLDAPTAPDVLDRLSNDALAPYLPFTLCAVDPGSSVLVADWTGRSVERSTVARAGPVRTSSGRDQRRAESLRAGVWRDLVAGVDALDVELLDRFHRSHAPERGPFSVCMHREEAETQCLVGVTVRGRVASMTYVPGAPCLGRAATVRYLALRSAAR